MSSWTAAVFNVTMVAPGNMLRAEDTYPRLFKSSGGLSPPGHGELLGQSVHWPL